MSYTALYRKYRPSTFEDVVGQKHIVTTLRNALEQNRLAHAYLFSGPSGNGKTSIAKLFAKAINCESEEELICDLCSNCEATKLNTHPDIVEIDAASNNGVDEIRSLIEKVKYTPLNGQYKVYIIDEVHMLSLGAFNALLKTLEEPPSHVVFILATTEPHKVIPTIISRCQRYDFTRVSEEDISLNIKRIMEKESITYEEEAVALISQLADGGVRESLSILEQTIAYAIDNVKLEDVRKIYGVVTHEEKLQLLMNIFNVEMQETLHLLNTIADQGNNLERLNLEIINILKETVIYGYSKANTLLTVISEEEAKQILSVVNEDQLLQMIDILMDIASLKKNISDLHAYLELGFIKMINIASTNTSIRYQEIPVEQDVRQSQEKNESKIEISNKEVKTDSIKPEIIKEQERVSEEVEVDLEEEIIEDVVHEEKTDVKTEKEEKIQKDESFSFNKQPELDEEMLLSLLANADKEKRIMMDTKWQTINNFITDVQYAKYAHKLKFAQLIAVGDNYALVCVENQIVADDINAINNQIGISSFVDKKMGEELCVFAITQTKSKDLISQFRIRAAEGTLPDKINVVIPKEEKTDNKNSLESKAEMLFGEDNYIMED